MVVDIKGLLARREEKLVGSGSTVIGGGSTVVGSTAGALDVKVDGPPNNVGVPVDLVPVMEGNAEIMCVAEFTADTEVIAEEV